MDNKIKAISLFSSAGIGELLLHDTKIELVTANELLPKRADCYRYFYPKVDMVCGDIRDSKTKEYMINKCRENGVEMLIATPPCQGLSTLGKNKTQDHYEKDERNYLVLEIFPLIDSCNFNYILIENVPKFIEMYFPYENQYLKLEDILKIRYSNKYNIDIKILNAKDYGICQSRPRAMIKMYKKGLKWSWPMQEEEITLEKAIGGLPSLKPGEKSEIKWHYAKSIDERIILALQHTPTGESAISNEVYYPKKKDGTRIKGFHNTYKRIRWDQPCPARTTYSGSVSSHNNVHPGRKMADGTYSDPRVLSLLETFIVSSIPRDISFPKEATETFIRTIIGESVPPKLMKEVIGCIGR